MADAHDAEPGRTLLGYCPNCEHEIPKTRLLVKYEADGEWPRMFAECPGCSEVVHPQ